MKKHKLDWDFADSYGGVNLSINNESRLIKIFLISWDKKKYELNFIDVQEYKFKFGDGPGLHDIEEIYEKDGKFFIEFGNEKLIIKCKDFFYEQK